MLGGHLSDMIFLGFSIVIACYLQSKLARREQYELRTFMRGFRGE